MGEVIQLASRRPVEVRDCLTCVYVALLPNGTYCALTHEQIVSTANEAAECEDYRAD